jgi:putative mycofactocin binding protein MftB
MGATMQLAKHVKFREEKFGGVLFETRSEKVFTLNATAAAVVREIAAGHDQEEIAVRLADCFSGPPAAIEREVASLIGDLRQKGLVEDSARG